MKGKLVLILLGTSLLVTLTIIAYNYKTKKDLVYAILLKNKNNVNFEGTYDSLMKLNIGTLKGILLGTIK